MEKLNKHFGIITYFFLLKKKIDITYKKRNTGIRKTIEIRENRKYIECIKKNRPCYV